LAAAAAAAPAPAEAEAEKERTKKQEEGGRVKDNKESERTAGEGTKKKQQRPQLGTKDVYSNVLSPPVCASSYVAIISPSSSLPASSLAPTSDNAPNSVLQRTMSKDPTTDVDIRSFHYPRTRPWPVEMEVEVAAAADRRCSV
jgi:hypothetical protein